MKKLVPWLLISTLLLAGCSIDPVSDAEHLERGDIPFWDDDEVIAWATVTPNLTRTAEAPTLEAMYATMDASLATRLALPTKTLFVFPFSTPKTLTPTVTPTPTITPTLTPIPTATSTY